FAEKPVTRVMYNEMARYRIRRYSPLPCLVRSRYFRVRLPTIFHMQRGALRYSLAGDFRDEIKRTIDAGRESGRGNDLAVIHVALVMNNFGLGCELFEPIQRTRDRSCTQSIKQTCPRQNECAGADRDDVSRALRVFLNPL